MKNNQTPIDLYIMNQSEEIQPVLISVRDAIRAVLQQAEERISWKMPTFWQDFYVIQFAAHKNHIGLYPGPVAIEHFDHELEGFTRSKGAVQFPYDKPMPLDLIARIAEWCLNTRNHP
jgi:uncharacterized protein YdhG (YjbR/CyaY superfamily)